MGVFKDGFNAIKGAKELGDYHGGMPSIRGSFKDIAAWSPDSKTIAYVAANRLFTVDADGSAPAEIAYNDAAGYQAASFSPDGKWLIYTRRDEDQNSDVYVYESVGDFWQIWIAGNRLVSDKPRPDPSPANWWAMGEAGLDAYQTATKALDDWMEQAERVAINLPMAGEGIQCADAGSCADELVSLQALGYYVPQFAIDALREEANESETAASGLPHDALRSDNQEADRAVSGDQQGSEP